MPMRTGLRYRLRPPCPAGQTPAWPTAAGDRLRLLPGFLRMEEGAPRRGVTPRVIAAQVCEALNRSGAKYLVIGGVACILHGYARTTEDVDILIERTEANAGRVLAALARVGYGFASEWAPAEILKRPITVIGDDPAVDVFTVAWKVKYEQAAPRTPRARPRARRPPVGRVTASAPPGPPCASWRRWPARRPPRSRCGPRSVAAAGSRGATPRAGALPAAGRPSRRSGTPPRRPIPGSAARSGTAPRLPSPRRSPTRARWASRACALPRHRARRRAAGRPPPRPRRRRGAGRARGDPDRDNARAGLRAPHPHPAGRETAARVRRSASSPPCWSLTPSRSNRRAPWRCVQTDRPSVTPTVGVWPVDQAPLADPGTPVARRPHGTAFQGTVDPGVYLDV